VRDTATDLSLLRAALRDARLEDAQRTARAVLVAGPGPHRAHVRFSVASTSRVAAAGVGAGVSGAGTLVPGPSASTETVSPDSAPDTAPDTEPLAAPEGDTAVAIALVQRAQAGDAEAFGELYDRYVDLVYRYVYYRVSSAQLAEDLTSETFLRALRRISSFTWQGRDVGAWFVTIARNLIADHYKSGRYRLELTTDDVSESGAALVTEGPEGAVLEAMQNKVLLEAVKQLGPEQQECIVLRFLQGLSVAETAQAMGKNEGAIKALQYRAIRTLGRLLPEGVEL
jgi:RNA polymerase sigma-70 factor, ECF subfamily